jgi:aspartate/methionine/tyrosine aminotransferase
MNPLAKQLNEAIQNSNPHVYEMLSDLGKQLFYPKGILSQSAEAKKQAHKFNATIGIATENGKPMYLDVVHEPLSEFSPSDLYPYAPVEGKAELRAAWREKMLEENISLQNKKFGNPVVTNALTHGLSIAADLFVNAGDAVVLPDKYWGNYNITFGVRRGSKAVTYPLFNENRQFNSVGLREALLSQKDAGKVIVLLNFPNNPTGYTPGDNEAEAIVAAILEAAEAGINVVALTDDAYFQLFFENSINESLFGRLANIHPRVLAVKIDGATKEEYVWGFRVGFITFASESDEILHALEQKTKGIIRATISSAAHPSQTFVLRALQDTRFKEQKEQKYELMKGRANKVKKVLDRGEYDGAWTYYPFNSGYFMCLELHTVDAEELRIHLLEKYGVGTISINPTDLRIAFSSVEEHDVEELFSLIYQGVQDLQK